MAVPSKHIIAQRHVIGALSRFVALGALARKKQAAAPTLGHELTSEVAPLSKELVRDYVRLVGGEPSAYSRYIPAHLFPHWAFPVVLRALEGIPYPAAKVVNAGCTLESLADLPYGEPLLTTAKLASIDDNGRRALLTVELSTGTRSVPEALRASFRTLVPLARVGGKDRSGSEKPRLSPGARELAYFRLPESAGLDFAKVTGDFNPIHWNKRYARAMGFRTVILHGFGSFAWTIEGLNKNLFAGNVRRLRSVDANFVRALTLPTKVGLYVWNGDQVGLGDAPGGPAYLLGSFRRA